MFNSYAMSLYFSVFFFVILTIYQSSGVLVTRSIRAKPPLVVNTWAGPFLSATKAEIQVLLPRYDPLCTIAWHVLHKLNRTAFDSIEAGCSKCEEEQCDGTVGYGGSPDEHSESTLDAMFFDGDTMNMGAVGGLRRIKDASSVARLVLENTEHSILVGDLATEFAKTMGFKVTNLSTDASMSMWKKWVQGHCQPNFWINVKPDPTKQCGPYKPFASNIPSAFKQKNNKNDIRFHDTINMIVIDSKRSIVAGTSSNGAKFKIPGRLGDAAIPGSGAYADSTVGAAVATGDGDVMMRFVPSSTIVELMRQGKDPSVATADLIIRIKHFYPSFSGALLAVSKSGDVGAACHGIDTFPFSVASNEGIRVFEVACIK